MPPPGPRQRLFPETATAYAVLAATLLFTAVVWYYARADVHHREARIFDEMVQGVTNAIGQRMEAYSDALYATRALFYGSDRVARTEFATFVAGIRLSERYPGIHSLGFVRRVPNARAGTRLSLAEPSSPTNPCDVPQASALRDPAQDEYVVVEFTAPVAQNASVQHALLRDPACRAAFAAARDNGLPAASKSIPLNYRGKTGPGFILLLPMYQRGLPLDTVDQRRRALTGFVFAAFIAEELFVRIMGDRTPNPYIDLDVFDGTDPTRETLLYDEDRAEHALRRTEVRAFETVRAIEVGGRRWTIHFSTLPGFHQTFEQRLPLILLLGGLVVSALLFRLTLLQGRRVVERREHAAALSYQAEHDSLTHLANRDLLFRQLQPRVENAAGAALALLLIDLDGFKEINDTLGHHSGDLVLQQIGPRIEKLLRPTDLLARLGGDEFALLITPLDDGRDAAIAWATRVLAAIREPFELEGIRVQIDASIGIALFPEHGADTATLLRYADVAMYQAKHAHRGYALYNAALDVNSRRQLALMSDMPGAIDGGQLTLYYQPKVNIRDRQVRGVEALLRWNHPREGLIQPADIIPKIERSTLVHPLTLWIIDAAARQCREWRERGMPLIVAVNISARNLLDTTLPDHISGILRKYDLPPASLELEVTESALISDPDHAAYVLNKLHARGVRITIDDFGTGYSSLAHLKQLPLSSLKIDASFVVDMPRDDNDAIIVRSTVELAHNLGMSVTAEGVETKEILHRLDFLGCDEAQGIFMCPPLPAAQATAWLDRHWRHCGARR